MQETQKKIYITKSWILNFSCNSCFPKMYYFFLSSALFVRGVCVYPCLLLLTSQPATRNSLTKYIAYQFRTHSCPVDLFVMYVILPHLEPDRLNNL